MPLIKQKISADTRTTIKHPVHWCQKDLKKPSSADITNIDIPVALPIYALNAPLNAGLERR
ncbi:hypothetical protein [Methanolobus bombayensis]|uniref:hypothetical protein n=1 Tax=Methanolobus bombayensis TaxID=38023 RepID=UPI001AEB3C41|nr:hypothetical protein [Methanolobus bombayensis]MBP1910319.1 hypothetical protein [Methanolobus bombayensis]